MKKTLSSILAIIMILTMIPTASASVDAVTGAVSYNFYANGHTDLTPVSKTVIIEDASGSKFFTDYGTDRDWAYLGTNATGSASSNNDAVIDLFSYHRTVAQAQNTWVAYKIRVPKTATYSVSGTSYYNSSSGTNKMDIYIAPLTGDIAAIFADSATYGTVSSCARTGAKSFAELGISDENYLIGSVNNRTGQTSNSVAEFTMFSGEFKELSLNKDTEYVLIFKQAASKARTITPASLTLTPEASSPTPTITASADKAELFVGDTAILSSVVTDSTGATIASPSVTYTTEDTDVISISGNVATGVSEGTATITATYTENLTEYTSTFEISVKSSSVTYKFYGSYTDEDAPSDIANTRVVSVESADGTKHYTNYSDDRNWAYLGASSATAVSNSDYIRIFNGYLGTNALEINNWVAFKIRVPKTATYSISGSAYKNERGTTLLEMYIAPLTGIVKTTFETSSIYSTVTGGVRSPGKLFTDLGISGYYVGTANINEKTSPDYAAMEITDAENIVLREDTEYVLVFNQGSEYERNITPRTITLTPSSDKIDPEDAETLENTFDTTATTTGYSPSVTVAAYAKDTTTTIKDAITETLNDNGTYTLTAGEVENYEFLYWAKGLTTERTIVSFVPDIESFRPTNGNNILIAVYESITDSDEIAKAEFYNANGQLLGSVKEADNGKITLPNLPSMAGYTDATHWALYGDTKNAYPAGAEVELNGTMLFVAQYDNGPTEVMVNGDAVPYGTLCTFEAEKGKTLKWWTKTVNGKTEIASLSDEYSFYAWENCNVQAVYSDAKLVHNTMKIILSRFGADTIMAEFIGFDDSVVAEKGIILGTTDIAMKTKNTQFAYTGLGNATKACGYVIIKNADGTTYTKLLDGEISLDE